MFGGEGGQVMTRLRRVSSCPARLTQVSHVLKGDDGVR